MMKTSRVLLNTEIWKWQNEFELLKQQPRRNGCEYANLIQMVSCVLGKDNAMMTMIVTFDIKKYR